MLTRNKYASILCILQRSSISLKGTLYCVCVDFYSLDKKTQREEDDGSNEKKEARAEKKQEGD